MSRLLALVAIALILAFTAIACAGDDEPSAQTGATANPAGETGAEVTTAATPIDATPAVAAPDQEGYRASIAALGTVQETCTYMADTLVADCTERGIYRLDPPPTDPNASCVVGLSTGGTKPEYILCSSQGGAERKFFVIQPQ
jgi:hypothetical protein